jgi:hypothetical protein
MPTTRQSIVSNTELIEAGTRLYDQFCDPTYAPGLGRTVMEAVDAGREEAFFAPAVNLAVNITLAACLQEEPYKRLPEEVSERAQVAQDIAYLVGKNGATSGRFVEVYKSDKYLRRGLRQKPSLADDLQDVRYLASQCESPFREVGRVAGGAFHALRKRGVNTGQADIVVRSRSLPLAASIPSEDAPDIYEELGTPYLWPRNFVVSRVKRQTSIEFSRKTIDLLSSYSLPLRGCPAATIYPYGRDLRSLIHEGWENIVYFLLLPGAKVKF